MSAERADAPPLVLLVAVAKNGVIGRDGQMPWSLPSDLKRFRSLTMGKPMIMGRKTLEAIGRVLDGRDTIVLTRSASLPFEGALPAHSEDEAVELARTCALRRGVNEIVIVGGAEIYRLFLARASRIELTLVDAEPEGDARFPALDMREWETTGEEPERREARDSAGSRFIVYTRRRRDEAERGRAPDPLRIGGAGER